VFGKNDREEKNKEMSFFVSVKLDGPNMSPGLGRAKHLASAYGWWRREKEAQAGSSGEPTRLLLNRRCGRPRESFEARRLDYGYA
jgi:hypothetical protein